MESTNKMKSGDASAGYHWRTSSGSGQGSQRTGRSEPEAVERKRRKPHFYDSRLSLHLFTLQCLLVPICYALRILLELAFKHKSIP